MRNSNEVARIRWAGSENGSAGSKLNLANPSANGASGFHQRLRISFLFLTVFQLVLIGISLFGWLEFESSYQRTTKSQEVWQARRQKIAELEGVAASAAMPSQEDFNSGDWTAGRESMRYAAEIFRSRADAFAQDLASSGDAFSQSVLPTASSLSEEMHAAVEQAGKAFTAFEAHDQKQFGVEMLYTDRLCRRVLLGLGELRKSAFESEASELKQQAMATDRVRTWSIMLTVIAAILALALIGYAWRLHRQLRADEAQLARKRSALETRVEDHEAALDVEMSECKRLQIALQTAEAQLAEAQRIAHLGIWNWDPRSGEMFWSDETCRLLGFTPQGKAANFNGFLQQVSLTDRDHVRQAFQKASAERTPLHTECRITRPHANDRVLLIEGAIQKDQNRPDSLTGFALDITDRKLVQDLMQRQMQEALAAAAAMQQGRRPT